MTPPTGPQPAGAAVTVDHVANANRCYPGEVVKLMTRVTVHAPVSGFELRIHLPTGVELDHYRALGGGQFPLFREVTRQTQRELQALPGADGEPFPLAVQGRSGQTLTVLETAQEMIWQVDAPQEAGAVYQYEADLLVLPVDSARALRSEAVVFGRVAQPAGDEEEAQRAAIRLAAETVEIQVLDKGRYLDYLPALYEQDDFMRRFLMLFESFWAPIERQIDHIENYFDPDLTPTRFLPWLASWFDLTLDGTWSEAQQRELVRSVMWLYRRRGTRVALQRYLEILTQHPVEISERRARNFMLGPQGRLGVGVALGRGNVPHTFTVRVRMPRVMPPPGLSDEAAQKEVERLEAERRELLTRLIDAEKPAHTSYQLEILPADAADEGTPREGAPLNGVPSGGMQPDSVQPDGVQH